MRFATVLAFAGLAISAAINNEASLTTSYDTLTVTSRRTSNDFGGTRSRQRNVARFAQATDTVIESPFLSPTPAKEWTVPVITIPTRAEGLVETIPGPVTTSFSSCSSGYSQVPSTYTDWSCSSIKSGMWGSRSCTPLSAWPTSSCSAIGCKDGETLRPPFDGTKSWTDTSSCRTTNNPFTRTNRFVARFAQASPAGDADVRRAGLYTTFPEWTVTRSNAHYTYTTYSTPFVAAQSTQDFGKRSQRWVGQHKSSTPTMRGGEYTANAIPICSFNLNKGQYDCPTSKPFIPTCSFDGMKGEYVCPTPASKAVEAQTTRPTNTMVTIQTVHKG